MVSSINKVCCQHDVLILVSCDKCITKENKDVSNLSFICYEVPWYICILHLIINEDNNIQTCSESQEEFESGAELLLHLQENLDTSGSKCCLELKKNKKNNVRFLNFMHNQVYFVLVFLFYKAKKKNFTIVFSGQNVQYIKYGRK